MDIIKRLRMAGYTDQQLDEAGFGLGQMTQDETKDEDETNKTEEGVRIE